MWMDGSADSISSGHGRPRSSPAGRSIAETEVQGVPALYDRPDLDCGETRDAADYDLITMNHDATIGPCGPRPRPAPPAATGGASAGGGGAGPRSGWNKYTLCVVGSTHIVFAPENVLMVETTEYLSGES